MIPGTVYTLERGGVVLGHLTVTGQDQFTFHGDFQPTDEFSAYRPIFDQDAALALRLTDDDSLMLLEKAEAVLEQIISLGLVLRSPAGTGYRNVLIGIEGDQARFRPLSPEEERL
ncbi:hypothetical protein [Deinococcus navajonensis]|uniref:Uncharacterized protein n=1 Tax=Deinococcus navajonensis TaxID=309884 RepID=A0ABV8XKI3_9DEIO